MIFTAEQSRRIVPAWEAKPTSRFALPFRDASAPLFQEGQDQVSLSVAFLDYWTQIFLYAYPLLAFVLCEDGCNDVAFGLSSFTWNLRSVNLLEISVSKLLMVLCRGYKTSKHFLRSFVFPESWSLLLLPNK